jgi:hypothetical protein
MLTKMQPKRASGSVFGLTRDEVVTAGRRLHRYDAPVTFTWQILRRTCGTFLTNAPGIFGAASAYRSAKQLGTGNRLSSSTSGPRCSSRKRLKLDW